MFYILLFYTCLYGLLAGLASRKNLQQTAIRFPNLFGVKVSHIMMS